jgi:hypothetical protein
MTVVFQSVDNYSPFVNISQTNGIILNANISASILNPLNQEINAAIIYCSCIM